jgi:triphosphoribosyl-dephospho-CoA synthase
MWSSGAECGKLLADLAIKALMDEAELTPKPGLVDLRSAGCHRDMDVALMKASALSLHACFAEMGRTACQGQPNQELRETLAVVGQSGEREMMQVTKGVNTHRGAIWAIGLLIAGAAIRGSGASVEQIATTAGDIAKFPDRNAPMQDTNGLRVMRKYGYHGARGEAINGFPHVVHIGLPTLQAMRARNVPEKVSKLNALLAIMASLDDSCLLYRGGIKALATAQQGAQKVLDLGGADTEVGWKAYQALEASLLELRVSPGGSADLLAAVLFLDELQFRANHVNDSKGGLSRGTVEVSI